MSALFHLEERRAWVRTWTHTVVQECEPDFEHFAGSGDGYVHRVLRVWIADTEGGPHFLREYLGSVTISQACIRLRDLRRVFRRAEKALHSAGRRGRLLRAELMGQLRQRAGQTRHPSTQ